MPSQRIDRLAAMAGQVAKATLATQIVHPADWVYELKWDGYRIISCKAGNDIRLMSRREQDWTAEFASIAEEVKQVNAEDCVIDGEVCALDSNGRPSFQMLQNRAERSTQLVYLVFDILYRDGRDLRDQPLEQRRKQLEEVIGASDRKGSIVLSTLFDTDPVELLQRACGSGMEGIVAKQKGSAYAIGRTQQWLKLKCRGRQEFAIVGYTLLLDRLPEIGALLLATANANGTFQYVGRVGTGFDHEARKLFFQLLEHDRTDTPSAEGIPTMGSRHFVRPKYVCEVEFSEWTDGGQIRQSSFQGLRTDKKPEECFRENAVSQPSTSKKPRKKKRT